MTESAGGGVAIDWAPRVEPLPPIAAAGAGSVAHALARRLLAAEDASLATLSGVAARGFLLVLGRGDSLPWVDGISYLGRDPEAPLLLVPTTLAPSVPAELVERALVRRASRDPPIAVLPEHGIVASAAAARALSRRALERWLGEEAP